MKTIVIIHGWNYKNYSKFGNADVWNNRLLFVSQLSEKFNVIKLNLPGFGGQQEPSDTWDLENFVEYFNGFLISNKIVPDFVLGYSFGAAIALRWKLEFKKHTKIVLISPAILRAYKQKQIVQKFQFGKKLLPQFLLKFIRNIYLTNVIKNPYYTEGTSFLRETYLRIVKEDLTNDLLIVEPMETLLIFGSKDAATPVDLLKAKLSGNIMHRINIIQDGGHDIANSHSKSIIELIEKFSGE